MISHIVLLIVALGLWFACACMIGLMLRELRRGTSVAELVELHRRERGAP